MNLGQLLTLTRSQLVTIGYQRIALDDVLTVYINDQYRQFVADVGNIDDIANIAVTAGVGDVQFPDNTLRIKDAELDGKQLLIINRSDFVRNSVRQESEPSALVIGERRGWGTIWGLPKANGVLKLWLLRSLANELVNLTDTPTDIDPEYHMGIVDGVVATILLTDTDAAQYSAVIAAKMASRESSVEQARSSNVSRRAKPVRTVAYGGL